MGGVSSCIRLLHVICQHFLSSLYWLSSALEREAVRRGSAIRTAITPITTDRSTLPMLSHICSLTLAAAYWEIALLIWSTPRPAFAGGQSQYDFRERRRYASRSKIPPC